MYTPINKQIAQKYILKHDISDFGKASIRQFFLGVGNFLQLFERFFRIS